MLEDALWLLQHVVTWSWNGGACVGFGEGRGLVGCHLWICVIGASFFLARECGLCVWLCKEVALYVCTQPPSISQASNLFGDLFPCLRGGFR